MIDETKTIEARIRFFGSSEECETFHTVREARNWIARRKRQLDKEGIDVSPNGLRTEVFTRAAIARAKGGAE